ncbi:MAG: NAD(P)H-binding protein [Polyangiaceae bacterium]
MKPKRVLIAGSSGMVGGHALDICLERPDVARVTSIVRKRTGREHPKLLEVVHADFLDFSAIVDAFRGHDACLFCVGVYTGQVPDAEFRRITVDVTVAFAEVLRRHSPHVAFCFLSGAGADPSEKSRMSFARYKGAAENALSALGFERLHVFRPGYIHPVVAREEPNFSYKLMRAVHPVLGWVYPNVGVDSDALARVMVDAALSGCEKTVLENRDIRALVTAGAGAAAPASD